MKEANASTVTLDLMVQDIEQLRKHLKIKEWAVFGHSFGGMLASYYASQLPQYIKGMILSSSGGIDMSLFQNLDITARLSEEQRDSLNYWNSKIVQGDTSYHARYQRGKNLAPAYLYDLSHVNTIAHRLTQAHLKINQLVFANMQAIGFDCRSALATFDKPFLTLFGADDPVTGGLGESLSAKIKGAEGMPHEILTTCGHFCQEDRPVELAQGVIFVAKKAGVI